MKKKTLKQRLASKDLRAGLPDSALPPDLLAKRKQNERNRQPFVPGSSLTYGDVAHERDAAVGLRYGQQQSDLAQHRVNSDQWFNDYRANVGAATAASNQRYQELVAQQQAMNTAGSQRDQQVMQGVQAQGQADAAQRGATYDNANAHDAALAEASRRVLADSFLKTLQTQGAAYGDYMGARQGVGSAAQLGERLSTDRAQRDLSAEKGAYGASYMTDRRAAEQKSQLENALFGLKESTAVQTAKDKRASRVVSRKNTRDRIDAKGQEVNKYGYTNSEWQGMTTGERQAVIKEASGGKPNGKDRYGNTKIQRRDRTNKWNEGLTAARQYGAKDSSLLGYLTSDAAIPYDIAQAVDYWSKHGGKLNPELFKKLRRLGIPVTGAHREGGPTASTAPPRDRYGTGGAKG